MAEHRCTQAESIGQLKEGVRLQEKSSEKLFRVLEGNGDKGGGLVAAVALLSQKIDQIPSPFEIKLYALLGGGAAVFIAFIGMIAFRAFAA